MTIPDALRSVVLSMFDAGRSLAEIAEALRRSYRVECTAEDVQAVIRGHKGQRP